MSRREPVRTCVGCRQEGGKGGLIRLVRTPSGVVALDPTGGAPGRGAYLHRDPSCIQRSRKRQAVERALGAPVASGLWEQLTAGG